MSVSAQQRDTVDENATHVAVAPPGTPLSAARLHRVKKAYTTRSVAARIDADPSGYALLDGPEVVPHPGDVVLARIERLGNHTRLESPVSRRQTLFVGDEVLVAYGHRYAPDQFEAEVPADLGPTHLVAAGGVAALATAKHARIADATALRPLGLLTDDHGIVTLERFATHRLSVAADTARQSRRPTVVAVLGTSMNSGKSTTVSSLIRGATRSGLTVAAGKVTGTGAGGDPHGFADAGASAVLDFTDFGFPSTFRLEHAQVRGLLTALVRELSTPDVDVVVLEVADGLYQDETSRLVSDSVFREVVDRVVFAADGAAGAVGGAEVLTRAGVPVTAVSGVLTSAPLAMREAQSLLSVPVIETAALTEPDVVRAVL